ncbi:MAG: hypothetical protein JWR69_1424, partial [Pedosphaera sp.]|nr:hypothetical protein [Pedosphaera sp.]
ICVKDIPAAAQRLSAYIEGCVLQARVQNDLSPLRELMPGALMVMGVPPNPAPNARRSEPPRSLHRSAPSSR